MADKKLIRAKRSLREQIANAGGEPPKRRLKSAAGTSGRRLLNFLKREYYLPLPRGKAGQFLNRRRHLIPRYFREAGQELKEVTWPTRKETWRLTLAVFLFALIFGLLIAVVDYGLDKLFKKLLLGS